MYFIIIFFFFRAPIRRHDSYSWKRAPRVGSYRLYRNTSIYTQKTLRTRPIKKKKKKKKKMDSRMRTFARGRCPGVKNVNVKIGELKGDLAFSIT